MLFVKLKTEEIIIISYSISYINAKISTDEIPTYDSNYSNRSKIANKCRINRATNIFTKCFFCRSTSLFIFNFSPRAVVVIPQRCLQM